MKKTAFEKQVKRRITARNFEFFAVCPPGLKGVCKNELRRLGLSEESLDQTKGGIGFFAPPSVCMELNLKLGSASRILMRIDGFKADTFRHLEQKMAGIDWHLYLPINVEPAFKVTCSKSALYHSDAVAQRCERIIRQHMSNAEGKTCPSKKHRQTIYIRAVQDRFTISLDSSGDPLYKRGIKKTTTPAPLRETIAFAMLKWTDFSADDILVDPMCGSGTFSLEAAMIKTGMPPGYTRSFAFQDWPGFSRKTFAWLKSQAKSNFIPYFRPEIFASDIGDNAVQALKHNASPLFENLCAVYRSDFFSLAPPSDKKGVIVLNPPYGKRLGENNQTSAFYRELSTKLKKDFKGWRAGIIFPSVSLFKASGLSLIPHPVFHGGLDVVAGTGII